MAGFKRVFVQNPGLNVLGNIESVNTIDIAPPANPLGAGSGVVGVVGEFEDGTPNAPARVSGGTDLEERFGGFGHEYEGVPYQYPVASKSAQSAELWNGNGFVALRNKRFAGLIVTRVDNSAGTVSFTRRACAVGAEGPFFNLAAGNTVALSLNGAGAVTATFTAAAATLTGSSGTYPTTFTGGETLGLTLGDNPEVVVIFQAGDQTLNQVIDRINSTVSQDVASDSGGELRISSPVEGWGGSVEISSGTARATLGLPTAPTAQVDTFTVNAVTGAGGVYTLRTQLVIDGSTVNYDASYTATGAESVTQLRDALLSAYQALGVPGVTYAANSTDEVVATAGDNVTMTSTVEAEPTASDVTVATTTPAVLTRTVGTGNVENIDQVSVTEIGTIVGALSNVVVDLNPDGLLRICNTSTASAATIEVVASSTAAAALGLTTGVVYRADTQTASTIPAGTRLQDSTNLTYWVTLETTQVPASLSAPLTLKVRPAVDDDSTPTCAAGDCDVLVDSLASGWSVNNAADLVRLSKAQMDVRYLEALNSTIDVSGPGYEINIIFSARSTANIGRFLRENALTATASGHRTRKAIFSPNIGTSRADAYAATGSGVGAVGREQRLFYAFPGLTTLVPEIAAVGATGGTGFTDDGVVQVRSDGFYASVASILPPEENRGQQLSDTNYGAMNALSLENAYNKDEGGVGLTIQDYQQFKAQGIIAPRFDRTAGMVFQSDVTSVDPATQPALVDAKRRFMGDFVIDSLSDIAVGYCKKLNKPARRRALNAAYNAFLDNLQAPTQPDLSRIDDFSVTDDTTDAQRAQGFQIDLIKVRIYPSMDYIVIRTEVGTTVNVEEV